jgi:dihydropteroate synthase
VTDAELSTHPLFGELATRLAPRGLAAPGTAHANRVHVALRHDRLEAPERATLAELVERGGSLEPNADPSEHVFTAPRTWLATPGDSSPLLGTLLAASDAAASIPARARLMGVVNVTPDSFSDGGRYRDPARAIEHGLELVAAGAEMLDVGGESTRPGSEPVELEEELERVLPVVSQLAQRTRVAISIDTQKSEVARRALDAGASIVNDVSAGRFDASMLSTVASLRVGYIAMHMQGTPGDMQSNPTYGDPVSDVLEFLRERASACLASGIDPARLWIDPGIGFGKRLEHNLELLRRLSELRSLGLPICLGVSRKSFIGVLAGRRGEAIGVRADAEGVIDRRAGTAAALTAGILGGAELLRVHDVTAMHEAAAVASAFAPWSTR